MAKISRHRTSEHLDPDGVEDHRGTLDPDTVGFEICERAGTRIVEFTPTVELERTMSVVEPNLAASWAG